MIRTRRVLLPAAMLTAALAGCSSDNDTAAPPASNTTPPASTAAAPATTEPGPIADEATIRQVCNTVVNLGNSFDYGAEANLAAGKLAERITDPKFSLPGRDLVKAAGAASAAPGPDTNLDIAQAQLAFLNACGDKYGDGPW